MVLERRNSVVRSESRRTSMCEPTSHSSAFMCGNGTSGSGPDISIADPAAGSQCSQPQSTGKQDGSLATTSNGKELAKTSLGSLHATQDDKPGVYDSKSHSASKVAQWLQDQKEDNQIPYLGVMEQEMGHEDSDLGDEVVNKT